MTMNAVHQPPAPAPTALGRELVTSLIALVAAASAGLGLGVVDLLWNARQPSAWSTIANSCAGWAAAAFVIGALLTATLRLGAARAALAAVVLLTVAVEAYYLAGVRWLGDDPSTVTSSVAQEWLVLSVIVGAVFGAAGSWAAGRSTVLAIVGVAAGASLLLGDALHLHSAPFAAEMLAEARILALLGALVLLIALPRPRVLVGALVLCVPFTLFAAAVFNTFGIRL
ncbi:MULTISPECIES: DUF6518 family protein [unclassified Nocardioides]|uniref:DUF6518 family protein n=1 Tax=unclassified Nocardioides TaxID=2615069 RepID=UPI0009F01444|nr:MULTISPECIES: DUF6518 family protein [unclassified Nocardioides]GAW52410.1 hypothetical protein PD653B2_4767 [Nocardioides sp. PD653-B2]GAW56150.1 hypothetical protein PD653_3583 [Nocardioides sp. PD653]